MAWWLENNIRMIQNNIRDIDARIDIDRHIEWLKSFDVNTLQIGCGGITAFHPSKLDFQWKSPYMTGDFFGEMLEKCHANGIRVIARFDFSKTHESFYENHKEWYFKGLDGQPVRYHDTVATCVNGGYQRERSLDILREVLEKYPVDGIFFNMFGYITFDYSGNYVGICQCDNCKRRFREMYGEELPVKEDLEDPIFNKYIEFKNRTVDEMLTKIHDLARSINPECAVSTYATTGIDIVRNESNSAVDRPLPFWIYNSSDNVGEIEGSYDDKVSSNCCINAVDLPYRFMGVSDQLNQIRLYGDMANGGGLDWCIIGNFDDYPDYENFDSVRKIFKHHKMYEEYYGHFNPKTKVMLVKEGNRKALCAEYRGVFRMLKEEHIPFTIVGAGALESKIGEFDDYDFILLPEVHRLPDKVWEALKNTKASVVASGMTIDHDEEKMEELFGTRLGEKVTDVRGTYLKTWPEEVFGDLAQVKKQWVFLDGPYRSAALSEGARGVLPRVKKAMFGPPERCYGHEDTEDYMAVIYKEKNVYLPWTPGTLYYKLGYDEFKKIFLDLMAAVRELPRVFETNVPEMVEMFFAECGPSVYMLQLLNLTGYNGMTFFKPYDMENLRIRLKGVNPVSVEEMTPEGLAPVEYKDGITCSMKDGELYKAWIVREQPAAACG